MNSLEILNILKSDAFTKTVFTDVLPSDRLPGRIQTRPRGFIVNTDPADKPGTHWLVIFITTDGKGEFWDPFAQTWILQSELYSVFEQTLLVQTHARKTKRRRRGDFLLILCI